MEQALTVAELIAALEEVEDKNWPVVACIMGVETGETVIVGITQAKPCAEDDIGICWLKLPESSSIHQD